MMAERLRSAVRDLRIFHPANVSVSPLHRLVLIRSQLKWLSFHIPANQCLFSELSIRFEHQLNGFSQVFTNFFERLTLTVGAGNLFDESDKAFGHGHVDSRKCHKNTFWQRRTETTSGGSG